MWKTLIEILKYCLAVVNKFHDTLHNLQTGRGTGTVSVKANLLQKLMDTKEEELYEIFLYLHKVYDALDRGRCIGVLAAYGVVIWSPSLLQSYLDLLTMVASAGG